MFIPTKAQGEAIADQFGTPVFITHKATITKNANEMLEAFKDFDMKIFYAIKANYNPAVVRTVKDTGVYGVDAVSLNEVEHALALGYTAEQIVYTPSNPSTEDMKKVGDLGVLQNLGSLSELKRFGDLFPSGKVSVRICPKVGAGEFKKITTGGESTKFGVSLADFDRVAEVCNAANVSVVGIHSHIGSGFYDATAFRYSVEAVLDIARRFRSVKHVNFGGGYGVQYNPEKTGIDLAEFAAAIKEPVAKYEEEIGTKLELRIEPGKYLVSDSTVLLAKVTTVKTKGDATFVGLNTGFNHLIRPAMYGAYHHVVNVSNPDGKKAWVEVVGNVCETCDVFNKGIELSEPSEGDLLAILVAGGYGSAMSSNYNMQNTAAEVMIDGDDIALTKRAQALEDVTRLFV